MCYLALKKKKSIHRLAVGIFLPAPVGTLLFMFFRLIGKLLEGEVISREFFLGILFIALMAYMLVGIQSVLYSVLMEYFVNRHVANNILAVLFSMILGILLGPILGISAFGGVKESITIGIILTISGALVGLIVGIIIRWMYIKAPLKNP